MGRRIINLPSPHFRSDPVLAVAAAAEEVRFPVSSVLRPLTYTLDVNSVALLQECRVSDSGVAHSHALSPLFPHHVVVFW